MVYGNHKYKIDFVRCRYLFTVTLVIAGSFVFFSYNSYNQLLIISPLRLVYEDHSFNNTHAIRHTIKTDGCTIPLMEPLSETIKQFVHKPENLEKCPNSSTPLLASNRTHIWTTNLEYYNITSNTNFSCCYNPFNRPDVVDINSYVDDRVNYEGCIANFTKDISAKHEFVMVECNIDGRAMYTQFFLFAVEKPFTLHDDRIGATTKNESNYNIVVIGIDGVSRLNFHRTMPKTLSYLKKKGAIELLGYNKVGDNSFPNIVPLLTGYNSTEIHNVCHPFKDSEFDNCPFVWNLFEKRGYYTAFAEDSAFLGTFNYLLNGFIRRPTHYYLHTFMNEAHERVGANKDFNSYLCMHNKYFFKVLLDYVEDLAVKLSSSRFFGFFWEVTMTHDYLNYPMVMDEHYEHLLNQLDNKKYLDETILIFLSDHGIRWGDIRSTKQGALEERLPLFLILTPPSFRKNFTEAYKNLQLNQRRLTTPFDIHETLVDLTNLNKLTNEKIQLRSKLTHDLKRGMSLFLPVPTNRTCKMAEIGDHFCACHENNKVPTNELEVVIMAQYLVGELNFLVKDQIQCENLRLERILEATKLIWSHKENLASEEKGDEYLIVIRTQPGEGVFEATLRINKDGNRKLMGPPSRLNLYGNQSHCVSNSVLKLYCFCKDQLLT